MQFRRAPDFTFERFPVSNRTIPRHGGDAYLGDGPCVIGPLHDAQLLLGGTEAMELSALYNVSQNFGIGILWTMQGGSEGKVDDPVHRMQMNQDGTPERGYGTALRFYQPCMGDFQQIGLTAQTRTPWLKPIRQCWVRAFGGGVFDLSGCQLATQGGWDRYDSDEMWESDQFARLRQHRIFGGISIGIPVNLKEQQDGTHPDRIMFSIMYFIPFDQIDRDQDAQDMIIEISSYSRIQAGLTIAF